MSNYILCGMQFGDEGKGTFVDYLTHKNDTTYIVKYNGGSQASHTVSTPEGTIHKFSQLGSGMFLEKCHTFLSENMVINLNNLVAEMQAFGEKAGISFSELRNRIHIHENCLLVTPYHKLSNKLREFSMGANRRGTVGTGVSEVMYIHSTSSAPISLKVRDIYKSTNNTQIYRILYNLQEYVKKFYLENQTVIWKNVPENMKIDLQNEITFLLSDESYIAIGSGYVHEFKFAPDETNFENCVYSHFPSNLLNCNTVFEGSQGLLIDHTYGIKPNTTFLDTTNAYAKQICESSNCVHNIGIAKAFSSRHGLGIFPTEDVELSKGISDSNQEETFWNGKIRFGWFDAVLLKYAQTINQVESLYLSSLDKLDGFGKIKICISYLYTGIIDNKFAEIFEYTVKPNGLIFISAIKKSDDNLGKYLKECCPIYLCVDGWMSDISKVTNASELPEKCIQYIRLIEIFTGIPISIVSVGPTRKNKIILSPE